MLFKLILQEHREEMKLLGVLCLLSAAVALPTQEQLHTNVPAPPSPRELKSEEKDKGSDERDRVEPNPDTEIKPVVEIIDESKESADKPEAEKDKNKEKPDDAEKVIEKDSKESKEPKDSKEKSKESQEYKEPWDSKDIEEPKEEKKDSKSEESKERQEEKVPVVVEVVKGPLSGFFSQWFPNFHLPWPFSSFRSKFRSDDQQEDQPIYIVKESDFDFN